MKSALYEGAVVHRRAEPRPHGFRYRLFQLLLDLDELPELFERGPLARLSRLGLARFRRSDYLGPAEIPLKQAVLDRVEAQLDHRPGGRVEMLTQVRSLGYVFNPVTFYWCRETDGTLAAIVAEITNTPWNERHAYVLDARRSGGRVVARFDKDFHVSPFHDMDQLYEWSFDEPGDELGVHMRNLVDGRTVFEARLDLAAKPLTAGSLIGALVRHPFLTLRVHLAIYWQALRLFAKRTPFHTHPKKRAVPGGATPS